MIGSPARFLSLLLLAAVGLLAIPLGLGYLGRLHPAFDSFAHFRLHLAALLGLCGLLLLAGRFRREGAVALLLAVGSFAATPGTNVEQLLRGTSHAATPAGEEAVYRLLQFNARFDNREPERFLSLVARVRPDVITMQEVSPAWRARLASLDAAYPHRIICDSYRGTDGVAILSRRPFAAGDRGRCAVDGALALAAVDLGGRQVEIASLHLFWPWPKGQADQIERLEAPLSQLSEAAILAGDFNATRWSRNARMVARSSGLADAGPVGPSWLPRALPDSWRPMIGLGIDHVLAGRGIGKRSLATTGSAGSDHLPVLFEFTVAPQARHEGPKTQIVRAPATELAKPI